MPEAPIEEIEEKIRSGAIRAITLDTSIFDGRQLALETGLLPLLGQFRGSNIEFVLSEVVLREILSHLTKKTAEGKEHLIKFFRNYEAAWQISPDAREEVEKNLLQDGISPEAVSKRRLDNFLIHTDAKILKAENYVELGDLMNRYFGCQAPFANRAEKKNEFPDALALLSVAAWAQQKKTMVLVVSGDGDWNKFCTNSPHLFAIADLGKAFALFNNEASVVSAVISRRIKEGYPALRRAIKAALNDQIDQLDFIADASSDLYYDDEFEEAAVHGFEFCELDDNRYLEAVESDGERLIMRAKVVANIDVTFSFSFSVKDSVDRDFVGMGSNTITRREEIELEILVAFEGDLLKEPEIGKVEVLPGYWYVEFGHVRPDWEDHYDDRDNE